MHHYQFLLFSNPEEYITSIQDLQHTSTSEVTPGKVIHIVTALVAQLTVSPQLLFSMPHFTCSIYSWGVYRCS